MSEPWAALKDEILGTFKDGLKNLADTNAGPIADFLKAVAEDYAKEKWKSVNAPEDEREEHLENLKELVAQVKGRYKRLNYQAALEVEARVVTATEILGRFLVGWSEKLLGSV